MSLKTFFEAFLQVEEELDLFNQRIDNVYFWERIRFPVCMYLMESAGLAGAPHATLERTVANIVRRSLLALKNIFWKNPYCAPQAELFFLGSPRRKLLSDGKWWDIYCDPIIESLDNSYVYFETDYLNRHFTPAKTSKIWYLDFPLFGAAIKQELGISRISLKKQDVLLLQKIEEQLQQRFKVRVDLQQRVIRNLSLRRSTLPLYHKILEKVNPKLVVLVESCGKETFIEVCKESHVPVVELQHGVTGKYNPCHSFPGPGRLKRTYPDYLFVFGDFWKEDVQYPIELDKVWSIGYPYLEREASKYLGVEKRDQVLFISQGTVGKELSQLAVALSKRNDFPFMIVYKLHPGEYARWRREYPWLLGTRIKVIDSDAVPLYQLLAESKIQVGLNSTAIYEGLYFGLMTILLNLPGVEYMERLIEKRIAYLASSADELVEIIRQPRGAQVDIGYFFKPNAVDNARKAINELLSLQGDKICAVSQG